MRWRVTLCTGDGTRLEGATHTHTRTHLHTFTSINQTSPPQWVAYPRFDVSSQPRDSSAQSYVRSRVRRPFACRWVLETTSQNCLGAAERSESSTGTERKVVETSVTDTSTILTHGERAKGWRRWCGHDHERAQRRRIGAHLATAAS